MPSLLSGWMRKGNSRGRGSKRFVKIVDTIKHPNVEAIEFVQQTGRAKVPDNSMTASTTQQPDSLDGNRRARRGMEISCCERLCSWLGTTLFVIGLLVLTRRDIQDALLMLRSSLDPSPPPAQPSSQRSSTPPMAPPGTPWPTWPPSSPPECPPSLPPHIPAPPFAPPESPPLPPPFSPPPHRPPPMHGDHMVSSASIINDRLRRSVYNAHWSRDGSLADAGVLFHAFDSYELGGSEWLPAKYGPGRIDQSGSLLLYEQRHAGSISMATFNGRNRGIIFRPGYTRIFCGKSTDSSGHCTKHCGANSVVRGKPWEEGRDKLCSWRPEEFGIQLERLTRYQIKNHRLFYNEIIIDAKHWSAWAPYVIEAIVGDRNVHSRFLHAYGLTSSTHPHVSFTGNWDHAFR
jgi:hypothetical protein